MAMEYSQSNQQDLDVMVIQLEEEEAKVGPEEEAASDVADQAVVEGVEEEVMIAEVVGAIVARGEEADHTKVDAPTVDPIETLHRAGRARGVIYVIIVTNQDT